MRISDWSSDVCSSDLRNRHHPGVRNHHPVKLARMTEFIPPGTRWIDLPSPFPMKRGGALHGARIAYETWGTRNAAGDNTILILTGLPPDAPAAAHEAPKSCV